MFWRGVWGYLPAQIIQGVVGFLAIIVFTRLLSAEDFGRYALAFSIFSLTHVVVFTWLEAAMARFWATETTPEGMASHFVSLYRAAFVLTAVFVPLAGLVIWFWPMDITLKTAVAVGLAGIPIRCLTKLGQERRRAAGEVTSAARLDMFISVGGLVAGVALALAGAGAAAPLAGLLIAPLLALPFVLPGEVRLGNRGTWEPARLLRYARFGYPIAAGLILSLVLASTDRFLLAAFLDEAAVGAYHAGYSIANRTLDVLFIWLGAAGTPALIMALERGGAERLRIAAREQGAIFILIGLPAAVGVALVATPLSEVLIGEDLRGAVSQVTPWIALSALLSGLCSYYFGQAFVLSHRTGLLLVTVGVPAIANVILNLILIPRFGVLGAAWATAASFSIGLVASIILGRGPLAMPVPWTAIGRCGLACGVMTLAVLALPSPGGGAELLLHAGVGGLVYSLTVILLNAAGVRDLAKRLIGERLQRRAAS
ncbi:MAG: polysaccharide biosynthesis protein [Alphaproteobacteria bacterium]|nr:MAG: polysaccharide biosynthesis protein [Alphaproteobacteria bacterium]